MVGSVLKPTVESTVIRVRFSVNPEEQVAMPKMTRRGHKKKQQNKKKQLSNLCYKKEELYEHRCNGKVLSQWRETCW